jgi:hypothetical protein
MQPPRRSDIQNHLAGDTFEDERLSVDHLGIRHRMELLPPIFLRGTVQRVAEVVERHRHATTSLPGAST